MTARWHENRNNVTTTAWLGMLAGALVLCGAPAPAQAVSKAAQELMALREKHAPVNCELTRLSRQLNVARATRDQDKVQALTERMQSLDKQIAADRPRMDELRKRIRGTPDYPALRDQQLKFDKACYQKPARP